MPTEVAMPRLGWDMQVGSVAEWLKREGERVEVGEPINIGGDRPWLCAVKLLGKNQQWEQFEEELPRVVGEDVEITCYSLQSRMRLNPTETLKEARPLWFLGRDLPENCTPLFNALAKSSMAAAAPFCTAVVANAVATESYVSYLSHANDSTSVPIASSIRGLAISPSARCASSVPTAILADRVPAEAANTSRSGPTSSNTTRYRHTPVAGRNRPGMERASAGRHGRGRHSAAA